MMDDETSEYVEAEHAKKVDQLRRAGEILVQRWKQLEAARNSFRMAEVQFRWAMQGQPGGWLDEDSAPSGPFVFEEHLIEMGENGLSVRKCSVLAPADDDCLLMSPAAD